MRAMDYDECLHEGDVVVVKTRGEIDEVRSATGRVPWPPCAPGVGGLYFAYSMYKYCGLTLVVDAVMEDGYPAKAVCYRLRFQSLDSEEEIVDERGYHWSAGELSSDVRQWSWVPSMLKWPDGEITEEIAGVDADSLFEILLS